MSDSTFFDELVAAAGDEDTARKVMAVFDRTKKRRAGLTDQQKLVYQVILDGKPLVSLRQLARDCGLDHPQKAASVLAALTIKGYLVPKDKITSVSSILDAGGYLTPKD
jgi:hypothetical protein